MKRKLVIFSAFFEPHLGGVERYVKELSLALEKKEFEILIITSDSDNIGFYENFGRIRILRLKHFFLIDGRLPVPCFINQIRKAYREIKQFSPSAIILNMRIYPLMLLGAYIARKLKIPAIMIDHTSGYFSFDSNLKKYLSIMYEKVFTSYLKKNVYAFYGVSKKVNSWLKNFGIEAKGVIHNGVNEFPESEVLEIPGIKSENHKFTIFFAGRLIPEKGIEILAKAYTKFRKEDTRLIICGDGPLLSQIQTKYNYDDIIFTGKISHKNVMYLLGLSDVAVVPSYYPEGLPTIILEAGISKCAVLTTDAGGALEIIKDEHNGLVIEKKSVNSIADNLEKLYQNRNLLLLLSENLNKTIKNNFVWSKIADDLIEDMNQLKM